MEMHRSPIVTKEWNEPSNASEVMMWWLQKRMKSVENTKDVDW
jgi:hypothetical protein